MEILKFGIGSSAQNHKGVNCTKNNERFKYATFAGGCFWCMVQPFERLDGVHEVITGYTGGYKENPTYLQVSMGNTGHFEAVRVEYDPSVISYDNLLATFWKQIDPTDPVGQFADKGLQYRTAIFYHDEEQRNLAENSKAKIEESGRFDAPIAVKILEATIFYPAEEYHQDYHKKNPDQYRRYKYGSGRVQYIEEMWEGGQQLER